MKTVAENNRLHIQVASERDVGTAFSVLFQYVGNASDVEKDMQKINTGKYVAGGSRGRIIGNTPKAGANPRKLMDIASPPHVG